MSRGKGAVGGANQSVTGRHKELVGWIFLDLYDSPVRMGKLAQHPVPRVEPGFPILPVRNIRKGCPESLKKRLKAAFQRQERRREVWVQPPQITRAFRMRLAEGRNHFRSVSFLAVAGMRSIPQVGLQRPLEAPFSSSGLGALGLGC